MGMLMGLGLGAPRTPRPAPPPGTGRRGDTARGAQPGRGHAPGQARPGRPGRPPLPPLPHPTRRTAQAVGGACRGGGVPGCPRGRSPLWTVKHRQPAGPSVPWAPSPGPEGRAGTLRLSPGPGWGLTEPATRLPAPESPRAEAPQMWPGLTCWVGFTLELARNSNSWATPRLTCSGDGSRNLGVQKPSGDAQAPRSLSSGAQWTC